MLLQPRVSAALEEAPTSTLRSSQTAWSFNPRNLKWFERAMWLCVIVAAVALRFYKLDQPIMWCDEAESCINAMTILQHGVPTDTYLGLPIFENALSENWPGNPEYEFRDSSYTSTGVTVYHGWLPLYSIAASFKAFGIAPATDTSKLRSTITDAQIKWRSIAARTPAAIFGVGFIVFVYLAAKEMYGKDAAWGALLVSALAVPVVHLARQARYYSLTVMLSMACCLFIWRIVQRGRMRDYICAAIATALLFHTHALTFAIVCITGALVVPFIIKQDRIVLKLSLAAAIVALAVVPWGIATGFFATATHLPAARASLDLPKDLFIYAFDHWPLALFMVAGSAWIFAIRFFGDRLPARIAAPFAHATGACSFLIAWCLIGWLVFMLMIPAVSLWLTRAYLGMIGPGIVLASILCAGFARTLGRQKGAIVGAALLLAFVYANSRASYTWAREPERTARMTDVINYLRDWNPRPGTLVFATPNDHLTITCYTDVPVQSIAPIRREFLDSYPHDIAIIEAFARLAPIEGNDALTRRGVADAVRPLVASVDVPATPLSDVEQSLLARQREQTLLYSNVLENPVRENPAIFRGYVLPDYSWWWQIFFYRFSGVEARSGENLNYLARLRNAHATILPGTYVVYLSPANAANGRN